MPVVTSCGISRVYHGGRNDTLDVSYFSAVGFVGGDRAGRSGIWGPSVSAWMRVAASFESAEAVRRRPVARHVPPAGRPRPARGAGVGVQPL